MKHIVAFDIECYSNYFLIMFKNVETGRVAQYEIKGRKNKLTRKQIELLNNILNKCELVGFNILHYDVPLLMCAMRNYTAERLHVISNDIIENSQNFYNLSLKYNLSWDRYRLFESICIDLHNVKPSRKGTLKEMGGRVNTRTIQDLPLEPEKTITKDDLVLLREYCLNDVTMTIELYNALNKEVDLRREMTKKYNLSLLSCSDAKIAESIYKSRFKIKKNSHETPKTIQYNPPAYLQDKNFCDDLVKKVSDHTFKLLKDGNSIGIEPANFFETPVCIGDNEYKIGLGGLHSCERSKTYISDEDRVIVDCDVTGYYPSIILNCGLYPKTIGEGFLPLYKKIVDTRLKAKKSGDKVVSDSLKIVLNGTFGKFKSHFSCLYSPELFLHVTLTGQLSLLLLISMLERRGLSVVSANTDGVVTLVNDMDAYNDVCKKWEAITQFNLEYTYYKSISILSVNNYIALLSDGDFKGKGLLANSGLKKNPKFNIVSTAIQRYLSDGIRVEDTINNCDNMFEFIKVGKAGKVTIDDEAVQSEVFRDGEPVCKVYRMYWSKSSKSDLKKLNGDRICDSEQSQLALTIDDPYDVSDVDKDRYIMYTCKVLEFSGVEYHSDIDSQTAFDFIISDDEE